MPSYAGPNAPYTLPNTRTDATPSSTLHPTDHNQTSNAVTDLLAAMGGVITSGYSYNPWQFPVEAYGAKGDGKLAADVSTNATQTFTSATIAANAAVNQWVMINGARGTNDAAAIGQITAINTGTNAVTISNPYGQTVLNTATTLNAVYGTDDTAAIQSAIAAAKAYALANDYYSEVLFKDRYYIVASGLTQTTSPYYNTQLQIPTYTANNNRKLITRFAGVSRADNQQYWNATVPNMQGTCLVSMLMAPNTIDATYGVQSVLGGPTGQGGFTGNPGGGIPAVFPNAKPIIENIAIWCTAYTNITALDMTWLSACYLDGFTANIFAQPLAGTGVVLNAIWNDASVFGAKNGVGVRFPCIGNNADVYAPALSVEGYTTGIIGAEHVRIENFKTTYTGVTLKIDTSIGTTNTAQGVTIAHWVNEAYQGAVYAPSAGLCYLNATMIVEGTGQTYDILDNNGILRGTFNFFDPTDSLATRQPVVTASGLKVFNHTRPPGHVASPTVPATTAAFTNPFWRDAAVNVSGGTVTVIAVDGTATGLTAGTVIVPTNKAIALTYSAAPAWNWTLL